MAQLMSTKKQRFRQNLEQVFSIVVFLMFISIFQVFNCSLQPRALNGQN